MAATLVTRNAGGAGFLRGAFVNIRAGGAPSHARKNSRNEDFVLVVVVATVSAFYLAVGFRHKLPTTTANYAVSYQSQGYRAQPHQR